MTDDNRTEQLKALIQLAKEILDDLSDIQEDCEHLALNDIEVMAAEAYQRVDDVLHHIRTEYHRELGLVK